MQFLVSFYENVKAKTPTKNIPFEEFIDEIQINQTYQAAAEAIRAETSKAKRRELKANLPGIRMAGTFSGQTDQSLITKSGLIGMDIDDLSGDIDEIKGRLSNDQYAAAVFTSVSGAGICMVFRTKNDDYTEAYIEIAEYLHNTYGLSCDPACKNISRFRYITFDELPYINLNCEVFSAPRRRKAPKIEFAPYCQNDDVQFILGQIQQQGTDLTASYQDWLRIGLAIAGEYGEAGRDYFHIVSQNHPEYSTKKTNAKYDSFLKASGTRVSIKTLFYIAAQAGLKTKSPRRTYIEVQAANIAKSSKNPVALVDALKAQSIDITEEQAKAALEQAQAGQKAAPNSIDIIGQYIASNFDLYRNNITKRIYCKNHEPHKFIGEEEINSIYVRIKQIEPKTKIQDIKAYINSDLTPNHDPFSTFLQDHATPPNRDVLAELCDTIKIAEDKKYGQGSIINYKYVFLRKWLMGIVAGMHGHHNELMIVLSGDKGLGKTVWLRNLLPKDMQYMFGTATIGQNKDDLMKMNEFLILLEDEFGGKSAKDFRVLKNVLSLDSISIRLPYGQTTQRLPRIASWCGTTNEAEIIDDPTGNRRFIPMTVQYIDHAKFEAIDRHALWCQIVSEYTQADTPGFRKPHHLTKAEMDFLNKVSGNYAVSSNEGDLLGEVVELPAPGKAIHDVTSGEILAVLKARYRTFDITPHKIGRILTSMGFVKRSKRMGTLVVGVYSVTFKNQQDLHLISRHDTYNNHNRLNNDEIASLPH